MKILALAWEKLLHERHSQPLGRSAFNLSLDQCRINRTTDIVSRGDLQHLHRSHFRIDSNLGQMRAKSEYGVRNALAIFVQRTSWRIERGLASQHIAVPVQRQVAQSDCALLTIFSNRDAFVTKNSLRALACIGQTQNGTPQFRTCHVRSLPSDECLA